MSVKTAIGLLVAICTTTCTGAVWVISNQNALKADLSVNTQTVNMLQEQIREIKVDMKGWATIQMQLNNLQTRGSDAVQEIAKQQAIFASAVEAFRREGSPGQRDRMDLFERRLSVVEKDLAVHREKDDERFGKMKP